MKLNLKEALEKVEGLESAPQYLRRDWAVIGRHFERNMPGLMIDAQLLTTLTRELKNYLTDPLRNGTQNYSSSHVTNLVGSLRKLAEYSGGPLPLTDEEAGLAGRWNELRVRMEATLKADAWVQKHFRLVWERFETWLITNKVEPTEFNLPHWRDFSKYLKSTAGVNPFTTANTYLHALKCSLEQAGYNVSQKKLRRTFPQDIELQIQTLLAEATRRRPQSFSDFDDESAPEPSVPVIGPATLKAKKQALRLYLDFHRAELETGLSIADVLDSQCAARYCTAQAKTQAYTRESMKTMIYNLHTFRVYARRAGLKPYSTMNVEEFIKEEKRLKGMLKKLSVFTKKGVSEKLKDSPLPTYAQLYLKIERWAKDEFSAIELEDREAIKIVNEKEKKKVRLRLATRYRNALSVVYLIAFSPRRDDFFKRLIVEPILNADGEVVQPFVFKTNYDTYHIQYQPSKTRMTDEEFFSKKRGESPWVNFRFPALWASHLERYLTTYRKLIHPTSPLLFPGTLERVGKGKEGFLEGARSCGSQEIKRLIYGVDRTDATIGCNDLRRILITGLEVCGLGEFEGYVTGHKSNGTMSKVARDLYMQHDQSVVHQRANRFYEIWDAVMDQERKRPSTKR
ncbi:MAG: hypothetical protein JNL01_03210 [Bdellovibrionales bacterium]|nr:hypothetical protein [Bdellovibrionales bacterium]